MTLKARMMFKIRSSKSQFASHWQPEAVRSVADRTSLVSESAGAQPAVPIDLSAQEKADLIAFLKTLTDESFLASPRFSDPWSRASTSPGVQTAVQPH
jgi:hypothetical protein